MPILLPDDRKRFERDGFLILRGVLRGERLRSLAEAADRYVEALPVKERSTLARAYFHVPLPDGSDGAHLLTPLADPRIYELSCEIMEREPVSNCYCINMERTVGDSSMFWHQDWNFLPKVLPAGFDAMAWRLEQPFSQIQWNLPLLDDSLLMVVPGSQRRDPTPAEHPRVGARTFEPGMPGAMRVELAAGDAIVYHCNILHAVDNPQSLKRRTIHWYWSAVGACDPFKGIFPHGLPPRSFIERLLPPLCDIATIEEMQKTG